MNTPNISEQSINYMNAYEKSLTLWPVPYKSYFVKTNFGDTHIIESGDEAMPPLVLLHGASMSSTMWYPNIVDWSKNFRVICIDLMGDKNKSNSIVDISERASYAIWLEEVFNKLNIEKADIVGLSYGALNTVNFLMYFPERVKKVVLMSPAATFIPFDPIFFNYAFGMVNNREGVEKFFQWIFGNRYTVHSLILEQMVSAMMWTDTNKKATPKENGFPYVFTDNELQKLKTPILLLLGEEEVMYNPMEAYTRVKTSTNITVEMVEGAGHLMNMETPEYVNKRVKEFLV
ncbi:alpha/beta fold hydrolase [Cytobacillus sp. FJAT-54145]|uniref:Alpha/beta fold hydrolase n=1 Tax=Cytobacillus spartinae TaxID=3299023 RepID=A0ABW6KH82_9BACI